MRHGEECGRRENFVARQSKTRKRDASTVSRGRRRLAQQLESWTSIPTLPLDASESGGGISRKRRERRIVLDLLQCTLTRRRHLHTRIEDSRGVEAVLHERESRACIIEPDALEERCSQSAVAVLAGECPAQSRDELRDFIEEMRHTTPPVGRRDVDERIDVDVRVARVPEDHAAESVARETLANATHVFGESRRWYGAV